MKWIITRHGETEENAKDILMGQLPGKLSKLGKEQAKKLAERLKKEKIDFIFSSDLDRAKHTAEKVAEFHPNIPFELRKDLRERHLGNFQGKFRDERWNKIKSNEKLMKQENMETYSEAYERVQKLINTLKENYPEKDILLVGHMGICSYLINELLGTRKEERKMLEKLKNTSVTIFEFDDNKNPKLKIFNCTKHLD